MVVASVPVTPAPALGVVPAGTVSGGHAWAHAPVQLVPAASVYRGIPALFSSTVPLLVEAVFTVAVALAAVVPVVAAPEFPAAVVAAPEFPAGVLDALGVEDPHAARTRAAAARAATTVPGRTRPLKCVVAKPPRRRSVV